MTLLLIGGAALAIVLGAVWTMGISDDLRDGAGLPRESDGLSAAMMLGVLLMMGALGFVYVYQKGHR